ncbi:hypothetical protein [Campylobacter sp. MIT 12-5580]|uniref:hypothetical protein n=1 Tax=Campylobacter sp. MIT 12-5580 TaxID=2040651 RepID=UPI0010F894F0|nr:hypothetical protein [Campylobacter sp. MIT 12-5580]
MRDSEAKKWWQLKKKCSISSYAISALKITRLLVDDTSTKKRIGTEMLILADILAFSISNLVGCKLIIVDAKNEAKGFYQKKWFQ